MQLYESGRLVLLWSIPILVGVFLWGSRLRRVRLDRLGDATFLERRLIPEFSHERRRVCWLLFLFVFLFSTLALARPQWGEEKRRIERKGVDVIFLLDTSLSMLAEDVKPDRLRKSKLEIKSMIRRFKGNRVGMVAFAGSSFLQCPLTLDYSAFLLFVDALKPGYIPNPGTSLGRAIELGVRAFSEESRKYRTLIIFSDGEDHEGGVEQALEAAKKAGVRIYAVGSGTTEGEPIPLRSESNGTISGYKKDRDGQVVITRLNPQLLEHVAFETGGLFLPATAGEKEIDVILKHLETLGVRKLKERLLTDREDHFQFFLFVAFLLLIAESMLGERKGKGASIVLPLLAFFVFSGLIDSPRSLVEKGNRNVDKKKYQSAVEDYHKAEVARPSEPVIRYNLGTALYKLYQYRDAERELEQALLQAKDLTAKARILYNYGNTKYRLGDFEKAIEAYKKALDLNPKDGDAKYNLEFLKSKKTQFEQKQQKQEKQNQEQKPNQEQKNKNQQQEQPKPQPQRRGEQNKEQPQPQNAEGQEQQKSEGKGDGQSGGPKAEQGGQQKEEQNQEQNQEEGEQGQHKGDKQERKDGGSEEQQKEPQAGQSLQGQMSKENALRILDALREGEQQLQDLRRPPSESEPTEVAKDW